MYTLKNRFLEAVFDGEARLVSLRRADGGNILTRPADEGFLAVLAFVEKERLENIAPGSRQKWKVRATRKAVEYTAGQLVYSDGLRDDNIAECKITLRVELKDEELVFTSQVENGTDAYITDFEFPRIGEVKTLGDGVPTLFVPEQSGHAYADPGARAAQSGGLLSIDTAPHFILH